jgi:exodeoxyribonuclease VII large subunit
MPQNELRDIYTISRLNREVKTLLEGFPLLWIEGEISNFKSYSSGHWYFSLKDEASQVSCAMFRGKNMLTRVQPRDGMLVQVRARVTLYEPRGNYQIIIEHMEEAGEGALRRQFEELKQKLLKEGLFDTEHKQPIPEHPHCLGVITSPSGAVIHDILTTLKRRFPALPVILYPVAVQGENSADEIVAAFKKAQQRNECDVLILARGGGSLEDLWSFNEEKVARAIYDCTIPVVSGVGHEVDITIADFVADQRAPTPTGAAELISPDQYTWLQQLKNTVNRLTYLMHSGLQQRQQQLGWLNKQLVHPGQRLQEIAQRLDELQARQFRAQQNQLRHVQANITALAAQLYQYNPAHRLKQQSEKHHQLRQRLHNSMQQQLHQARQKFTHVAHSLDTVSPLATLHRGYAIVTPEGSEHILRSSIKVDQGDNIVARLDEGKLHCTVNKIESK